jgi:hypothetical protein
MASTLLAGLFGLGLYVGGNVPGKEFVPVLPPDREADGMATGSIVFVPLLGNRCRQSTIDNATWRIEFKGIVDCHAALYGQRADNLGGFTAARLDVVREGFRKR